MPKEARWSHLQANAKLPSIGKLIDEARVAIEAANASLNGVLPKDYNRPALDKVMLGELIDLISGIALHEEGANARDLLKGLRRARWCAVSAFGFHPLRKISRQP